jgi:hypothetical protein
LQRRKFLWAAFLVGMFSPAATKRVLKPASEGGHSTQVNLRAGGELTKVQYSEENRCPVLFGISLPSG